jgi:DNA-binding response OmpR family regulator
MRLLVVEDDKRIASFLLRGLKQAGYAVDHADDGREGLNLLCTVSYDTAVLDLMLPDMNGLAVLEQLRRKKVDIPVIILSAKRSIDDRVLGLQKGGDDYLTKPFAFTELLARIQALIRRKTASAEVPGLTYAEVSVNLLTREVIRGNKRIELLPREFSLLEYLIRNAERIVSKNMILEHLWDFSFEPQANVVDVLICRLRNKIDRGFNLKLIHTLRGAGYVFKAI